MKGNNWEKDLENILIEWEGKTNPVLGTIRVASRTETLKKFISSLIATEKKALLEIMEEVIGEDDTVKILNWTSTKEVLS